MGAGACGALFYWGIRGGFNRARNSYQAYKYKEFNEDIKGIKEKTTPRVYLQPTYVQNQTAGIAELTQLVQEMKNQQDVTLTSLSQELTNMNLRITALEVRVDNDNTALKQEVGLLRRCYESISHFMTENHNYRKRPGSAKADRTQLTSSAPTSTAAVLTQIQATNLPEPIMPPSYTTPQPSQTTHNNPVMPVAYQLQAATNYPATFLSNGQQQPIPTSCAAEAQQWQQTSNLINIPTYSS